MANSRVIAQRVLKEIARTRRCPRDDFALQRMITLVMMDNEPWFVYENALRRLLPLIHRLREFALRYQEQIRDYDNGVVMIHTFDITRQMIQYALAHDFHRNENDMWDEERYA